MAKNVICISIVNKQMLFTKRNILQTGKLKTFVKEKVMFYETYLSGTQLLRYCFDHTVERREGQAPPLYRPHKDRKNKRRFIGIPLMN